MTQQDLLYSIKVSNTKTQRLGLTQGAGDWSHLEILSLNIHWCLLSVQLGTQLGCQTRHPICGLSMWSFHMGSRLHISMTASSKEPGGNGITFCDL